MARPKGVKNKKVKVSEDPMVQEIVEIEVEFICPKRGKMKQKVKMKRMKHIKNIEQRTFVGASSLIEDLESKEESISSREPDPED